MITTAILAQAQSLSLEVIFKSACSVVHHHGRRSVEHAVKIDCVPAKQVVRKPENTIIVQQALNFLIMATVQDQENEHTEDSTTVLVEMRSRQCDDGAWGTSWVQQPESDKYLVRMRIRLLEV